jgi:hypothetical protein
MEDLTHRKSPSPPPFLLPEAYPNWVFFRRGLRVLDEAPDRKCAEVRRVTPTGKAREVALMM